MTNTEISPARWTTSASTIRSSPSFVHELLRVDAPFDEVEALFESLTMVRGVHSVEICRAGSPWFSLTVRGTVRGCLSAENLLMESGLHETDSNADHDHEECLARARMLGAPPSWAHSPETYLSS